jgi:TolB-like protein
MRQAMTRIWKAMRGHLTRWMAAGRPPPAKIVTQSASVQAAAPEAVPVPAPVTQRLPPPGIPSVAVLAFNNVSGEADQEDLADAITDDITTQLSHSSTLFVVARNSSFAYKGQSMKLAQLGHALGAGYLLGGNVRRDGEQVLINARLMEAQTGKQMWAERFERAITDLFEVQDAIADAAALAIAPKLSAVERERIACKPIVSHRMIVGIAASGRSIGCAHRA